MIYNIKRLFKTIPLVWKCLRYYKKAGFKSPKEYWRYKYCKICVSIDSQPDRSLIPPLLTIEFKDGIEFPIKDLGIYEIVKNEEFKKIKKLTIDYSKTLPVWWDNNS